MLHYRRPFVLFFFNDTATTEIYTLSLHDALPIFDGTAAGQPAHIGPIDEVADPLLSGDEHKVGGRRVGLRGDRKSTRLNSSHGYISYAVFCLKKKKNSHKCSIATRRAAECAR